MRPKIYLCKSKAGNPDHIRMVQEYLARFDCDVLEFEGGKYSFDTLDKADHFILIPLNHDFEYGDDKILVGKGQWTEYDHYLDVEEETPYQKANSGCYVPHIVVDFQGETPMVAESDTCDIISEDWKTKYAILDIPNDEEYDVELSKALELVLKVKDTEPIQESIKIEIVVDSAPKKLFKF
jgi:hypothetical protein